MNSGPCRQNYRGRSCCCFPLRWHLVLQACLCMSTFPPRCLHPTRGVGTSKARSRHTHRHRCVAGFTDRSSSYALYNNEHRSRFMLGLQTACCMHACAPRLDRPSVMQMCVCTTGVREHQGFHVRTSYGPCLQCLCIISLARVVTHGIECSLAGATLAELGNRNGPREA